MSRNRSRNRHPLNYKNALTASLFVNLLLLIAALILTVTLLWNSGVHRSRQAEVADPGLTNVDTVALRDEAYTYGISLEYLQMALPDYLVYAHRGAYHFDPLDPALSRHPYDWDCLESSEGRIYYRDDNFPEACLGTDVSFFQGEIDWPAVAACGLDFALVRLAYRGYGSGELKRDELAEANLDGAAAAGLEVGAYVFSQAVSVEEAEEEADLALAVLNGRQLSYPVAFDMEEIGGEEARTDALSPQEVTEIALAFCQRIKKGGYQPAIYGNTSFLAARLELASLKKYPLWFAQYSYRPFFPYDFKLWQYSDSAQINGIAGNADLDICFTPGHWK